jgi:hypothetical protein
MTTKEILGLQRLTLRGPFECTMSIGEVRLIPQVDGSYYLMYPSYFVHLYIDKDIDSHDRYYLRYMYNEYMSCMSI